MMNAGRDLLLLNPRLFPPICETKVSQAVTLLQLDRLCERVYITLVAKFASLLLTLLFSG